MNGGYNRLIEQHIKELQADLPAVAVEGLKGVGKTVSTSRMAQTVFRLDNDLDFVKISNAMGLLETSKPPVLIDEWQKIPSVWDFVRRQVDDGANPGTYLLTGSIANQNVNVHSGAGRILKLRMYPLSLAERGLEIPTVSLAGMLNSPGPFPFPVQGETSLGYRRYMEEVVSSGLPGIRRLPPGRRRQMLDSYLENLLSHEFMQQGVRVRQPQTMRRWLRAYAAATATDAGYKEILDASTPGEGDKPSAKTTLAYREALGNLWLIDSLPYWLNGEDYYARLKRTPKHYLADPALEACLLNIDLETLAGASGGKTSGFDEKYGNIAGRLFESLVHLSLSTYASVNDASLSWIRTANGDHEVDFIVQKGRKIVAIEVKLAIQVNDADVKHLHWLKNIVGNDMADALIVTAGPIAYRRPDGIAVVPAALLGA